MNKVASLPSFLSRYINLLKALLTNLSKIKKFINISIGKDLKVVINKPKWLNKYPLVKDLIATNSNLLNNAIF